MNFAQTTVEGGHVKHGNDSSAYVRFHKKSEKGVSKDFVEIMFPGDTKTIVNRQVKEEDKMRWPQYWDAYERGESFKAQGFPLEQWHSMDEGLIRMLNLKHVYTVEQLAQVTDQNGPGLGMGWRELVSKAKAFVEVREKTSDAMKYAEQYQAIAAENKLLQDENKSLAARLQLLEDRLEIKDKSETKRGK